MLAGGKITIDVGASVPLVLAVGSAGILPAGSRGPAALRTPISAGIIASPQHERDTRA
jgi:hypothetical protein